MKTTVGRIVHVVLPEYYKRAGEIVPAIIVRVWDEHCVQLKLFLDEANDPEANVHGDDFVSSAVMDSEKSKGTWHWPHLETPTATEVPLSQEELFRGVCEAEALAGQLCHNIEHLDASPLQSDVSLKASELRQLLASMIR